MLAQSTSVLPAAMPHAARMQHTAAIWDAIEQTLRARSIATTREIADAVGLSLSQAQARLMDLREMGEVRLALRSVPRTIYELDGEPELAVLALGGPVVLRDDRWGLAAGAPGVVVMMRRNWLTGRVTPGVMV